MKTIKEIKSLFEAKRNPEYAIGMQNYMRDKFLCLGINSPERNEISKPIYSEAKKLDRELFLELVNQLWELPEREYQYLACELLKRNPKKLIEEDLDFLYHLITTKSWWDTVDTIAANPLGKLLLNYPELRKEMDKWIKDSDMWIRRSAILYQLKYQAKTDEPQLFKYCLLCCHEQEFFIRKAIGWALRQHAKLYPENVRKFVSEHENDLSNLSKKEALKNIS